jgi:glycosyltransferase involved in cell wall biosynthesis
LGYPVSGSIWVIYPFTASTIGAEDEYVIQSNITNAFLVALNRVGKRHGLEVHAVYLTDAPNGWESVHNGIRFRFFPVTIGHNRGPEGFGKQWSLPLVKALVYEHPYIVFLFIGGGWFAISLAAVCKALSVPYCPIVAGWGIGTRRSLRWYYKNGLRTIVHTEAHKRRFAEAGVDTLNFLVMPMGVDTGLFQAKPESAYYHSGRAPHFITVGRIVPGKNLIGALRAFDYIRGVYPNSMFSVVGPVGDSQYWTTVQRFISECSMARHVRFCGTVRNDLLPAFYQGSDMMLFPSLSESFGFVIAESMACGTPVAALRGAGSPDELIDDGVDGILADNEEQLALRVIETLKDEQRLRQMAKAARRKVEERYSIERTYEQLVSLLFLDNEHNLSEHFQNYLKP